MTKSIVTKALAVFAAALLVTILIAATTQPRTNLGGYSTTQSSGVIESGS